MVEAPHIQHQYHRCWRSGQSFGSYKYSCPVYCVSPSMFPLLTECRLQFLRDNNFLFVAMQAPTDLYYNNQDQLMQCLNDLFYKDLLIAKFWEIKEGHLFQAPMFLLHLCGMLNS